MPRQNQASEFNTFVGGLVTEASPLTFPPNSMLDVNNFSINKTGTITRRLGMDYEDGFTIINSGVSLGASGDVAVSTFLWENAGGDVSTRFSVVQVGRFIKFFSVEGANLSNNLVYTFDTGLSEDTTRASAASVDGILVVAVGSANLYKFNYSPDSGFSVEAFRLKIRDVFGVEDTYNSLDLRDPENINIRPSGTVTEPHVYNLRNSTYATPRIKGNEDGLGLLDPIGSFLNIAGVFPSNSDSVTSALFADPNDGDDRFTERFFADTLVKSPIGNFESPRGYFIIDALERGASRLEQVLKLESDTFPDQNFIYSVTTLPQDRTPGGATLVSEFAGRMWYGGFSGEVINGDNHSPKLSSYLFYSKLVGSTSDLSVCHQEGDPTSKTAPDLISTDGGFIRLDGAYGINRLINIGQALVVVAENGVWAVLGGSDFGFSALDNKVVKVTEHGCDNGSSVVLVDGSVIYWGDDGIYQVGTNEVGELKATNISTATIQTLYEGIPDLEKLSAQGHYDSYDRRVRWLYGNRVGDDTDTVELILDINIGAFYKNTIPGVSTGNPNLVALIEVPPFKVGDVDTDVYYGGEPVLYGSEQVVYNQRVRLSGFRELAYVCITSNTPVIEYTFCKYKDINFVDWKSNNGVGVDSPAYLLTGYEGGGDFQRYKQVPYITFHLERTETGYIEDELGDIYPNFPSSCMVQAQWEWANSATSGRWGKKFQAYRHRRVYIPENASSSYDNGFSTVISKSKLRGKGKVLSLLIETEPLKDCRLLGWSMLTSGATNV